MRLTAGHAGWTLGWRGPLPAALTWSLLPSRLRRTPFTSVTASPGTASQGCSAAPGRRGHRRARRHLHRALRCRRRHPTRSIRLIEHRAARHRGPGGPSLWRCRRPALGGSGQGRGLSQGAAAAHRGRVPATTAAQLRRCSGGSGERRVSLSSGDNDRSRRASGGAGCRHRSAKTTSRTSPRTSQPSCGDGRETPLPGRVPQGASA